MITYLFVFITFLALCDSCVELDMDVSNKISNEISDLFNNAVTSLKSVHYATKKVDNLKNTLPFLNVQDGMQYINPIQNLLYNIYTTMNTGIGMCYNDTTFIGYYESNPSSSSSQIYWQNITNKDGLYKYNSDVYGQAIKNASLAIQSEDNEYITYTCTNDTSWKVALQHCTIDNNNMYTCDIAFSGVYISETQRVISGSLALVDYGGGIIQGYSPDDGPLLGGRSYGDRNRLLGKCVVSVACVYYYYYYYH